MNTRRRLVANSLAADWRTLRQDIYHHYAAARHRHPDAVDWRLELIIDPRRLPIDAGDALPDALRRLHTALNTLGLSHAVHARLAAGRHWAGAGGGQRAPRPAHRLVFDYRVADDEKNSPNSPVHPALPTSTVVKRPPSGAPRPATHAAQEKKMPIVTRPPSVSNTPPTTPKAMTMNAMNATNPMHTGERQALVKALWRRFGDWIFGEWPPAPPADAEADAAVDPVVEPPSLSGLQAFNQALSEATARFIRDYVDPVHAEDAQTGFRLRSIEAAMPAGHPLLRLIAEMPGETRNRIAHRRCLKAHGAREQLLFDDFYGLDVVAPETLVDGYLVRNLLASEGSRLSLVFRFAGDYATIPAAAGTRPPAENDAAGESVLDSQSDTKVRPPRRDETDAPADSSHTRVRPPQRDAGPPALFYLCLQEAAGEKRLPVHAGMLPLTIGSAPRGPHDLTVHADRLDAAGRESFVSGEHLTLVDYHPASRQLYVHNRGRNGTFAGDRRFGERFTLPAGEQPTLSLGGPAGEAGTASLRIEAA